ncbi:exodeoxyribonuclease [Plectosphaerella plurivora]|uniref:Exodeoxyribonuclease n=1 Tax=Plectosphaerella plurivora TaxID=936078 RepID=A0A9P9A6N8_9PEZI|nr:exodeoxyribonuclease [Plectosphaerella plurivora]
MGVSGLLPLLKSIHRPTELKKFAGETLAVDAYGWLHRGAIACAVDLAQDKPTRKYVDFAMHRVRMLRHFGVTPYIVFDGDFLPSKAMTEGSRAKRRDESKKLGQELLKAGKASQAFNEFQKAIDVTPEMARNLIDELKQLQVPYVVAPYEADAQMVYLERQGLVSGIISEDSDLLVFGCKRLLTKLDQYGNCIEVNRRDFCAVREVSLTGWTDADFRHMAILSGCDYLAGINNMGLKTAYRMIRKHKTPERLIRMIQFEGKHRVPEDYMADFTKAELTFLHQRVYCPSKKELVFLTEPAEGQGVEDMPFIGAHVDAKLATAIAVGDVNPITKLAIIPAPMPDAKRRHSQSASRLATVSPATRRPDVPTKPIDSYFKGNRRIPMAEMDPNCFSVDPQRVAQLTHGGLVPRVFPLPRPYLDEPARGSSSGPLPRPTSTTTAPAPSRQVRRRSEPIENLLAQVTGTAPTAGRRQVSTTASSTAEIDALMAGSGPRPQKKARLCSGAEITSPIAPEAQKSKFFPQPVKHTKDSVKDAFLFSDDSIDKALLNLPDLDAWHEPVKKTINVFDDKTTRNLGGVTNTKDDTTVLDTDESSSTPLRSTLQSFCYSASSSASTADTPASAVSQGADSIFTPSTGAPSTVASSMTFSATQTSVLSKPPALTPLQRLGARALQRKPTQRLLRSPNRSPERRDRKLAQRLSVAAVPVNPAFVPLPKVNLAEVEALGKPLGSEDHIIPDSDGENEADDAGQDQENSGKKLSVLNLSRFAYV